MFYAYFMCCCTNSKLFSPEYLAAGAFSFPAKKTLFRISSFLRPSILPQAFYLSAKKALLIISSCLCPRYLAAGAFLSPKQAFSKNSSLCARGILPQALSFRPKRRLLKLGLVFLIVCPHVWSSILDFGGSEVGGVSPTGKSFRFVRACARSGCKVRMDLKSDPSAFPFSLLVPGGLLSLFPCASM